MHSKLKIVLGLLMVAVLLCGCGQITVDQMYAVPRRSAEYLDLQLAIDEAMDGMEYCAPLSGENRQSVQMADLDGDGSDEYLLFVRDSSEHPLKIMIFNRDESACILREIIESRGSGFELVEYADIDGEPGVELVVGCQLSDQVLRYLTVYSFASGDASQLLAVNYSKFLAVDLDADNGTELMVISPGDSAEENAVAALYHYADGTMTRSRQARLSEKSENIKRIMVSRLFGGMPAVYVASSVEESAIITDVFALKDGEFTNVSLSNESGTSVQTLRNHYVYAVDIDNDGTLELPCLMNMLPVQNNMRSSTQHLIRWYSMTMDGEEMDSMHTFHNFDGGWYVTLDRDWASRVSVTQESGTCTFYVWDETFEKAEKLLTVYALTGSSRELDAESEERFAVYKTDGVTYAAKLEVAALSYGLTKESLMNSFRLIHMDWKTGET